MKSIIQGLVASILVIGGGACATSDETIEPTTLSSGARALGISSFDIRQSADLLEIDALDASSQRVAHLQLTTGHVTLTLDEATPRKVIGRQLSIEVLGNTVNHESEGLDVLALPLTSRDVRLQAFVMEPQVTEALAMRGVTFDTSRVAPVAEGTNLTEQAYASYHYDAYPEVRWGESSYSGCGTTYTLSTIAWSVYPYDGIQIGEYRCCYGQSANERRCTGYGSGASTACGTAGPAGCAVCWSQPGVSSCQASELWINYGEYGPSWTGQINYWY